MLIIYAYFRAFINAIKLLKNERHILESYSSLLNKFAKYLSLYLLTFELAHVEVMVEAVLVQQFLVRALFDYLPVIYHQ